MGNGGSGSRNVGSEVLKQAAQRARSSGTKTAKTPKVPKPPKAPKPLSATQRKTLATKQLLIVLNGSNEQAVLTAALEVVNERLAWDKELEQNLRQKYEEIDALKAGQGTGTKETKPLPQPIRTLDKPYNPHGGLNPYDLLYVYGHDQFRAVLETALPARLRDGVDMVQERNPGTAPRSRSKKNDMIDYIVEHVAGPGY